jgi:putative membrane protein (TIGR04086 family)
MRWGRIIVGGLLAEVILIVVAIPALALAGQTILNWTAVIGSAVTSFIAALWVCKRLESRFALSGALTGMTAMLIYLALLAATGQLQAQPGIYWVAHALKILGGAAGGMFAARRITSAGGVARASV